MSSRTIALALGVGSVLCMAPASPVGFLAPRLTAKEVRAIDSAGWAYQHGDSRSVIEHLSPLIARASEDKVREVDRALDERGAPSSGRLLGSARLTLAQQGLAIQELPKPGIRESVQVLADLKPQIDSALKIAESHAVLGESLPRPASLDEFERVLWSVHVLENRLNTARRMTDYMVQLANRVAAREPAKLPEADRELVAADHAGVASQLSLMIRDLEEREMELRIARLRLAREALETPALTRERFLAAFAAAVDTRIISEFFAQARRDGRRLGRGTLQDRGTADRVAADAKRARELAGSLTEKAQLLFEGLHWWLRGRYGIGPEVGGLAKSPAALHSAVGQLALYMPEDSPKPRDPYRLASDLPTPMFDRRHHFWWTWEDRRLRRIAQSLSVHDQPLAGFKVTTSQFW